MPGLSLILASEINQQTLSRALADLESDSVSEAEILYKDDRFVLAFSGHTGYPYRFHEDETSVILFEGMVYNRPVKETADIVHALAHAFSDEASVDKYVRDFVSISDGDFLCAVYSKSTSSLLLFNDHYGRLHSFYYKGEGIFAVSREMKFLLHFMPELTIDRFGLAQFLMFEYTLGDTSLFRAVKRLLPSQVVQARFVNSAQPVKIRVTQSQSLALDFDETDCPMSKARCIDRLTELFMESLENRYSTCRKLGYSCIADVSGGFDTRTVMLGLEKLGADIEYFTHDLVSGDESHVAQKVGEAYGKPVRTVSASHEFDFTEVEKLVYATDCMVNGWTTLTSWRDSSEKRRLLEGKVACFMGFGGEFIRHPLLPARGYHTLQSMLRAHILKAPMSTEWACLLAGISCETFVEMLEAYFESYPERTITGKLKRLYFEYYNILVTAGEDRTRRLFWTTQPLWGKDLYAFEMNEIPLDYAHFSFYAAFIRALDPRALGVPVYGSNVRLDSDLSLKLYDLSASLRYNVRNHVLSNRFLNRLYFRLKGRDRNTNAFKVVAAASIEVHNTLEYLKDCINKTHLEQFIARGYGKNNLYRLLSVLMYFKQLEERFAEKISAD